MKIKGIYCTEDRKCFLRNKMTAEHETSPSGPPDDLTPFEGLKSIRKIKKIRKARRKAIVGRGRRRNAIKTVLPGRKRKRRATATKRRKRQTSVKALKKSNKRRRKR